MSLKSSSKMVLVWVSCLSIHLRKIKNVKLEVVFGLTERTILMSTNFWQVEKSEVQLDTTKSKLDLANFLNEPLDEFQKNTFEKYDSDGTWIQYFKGIENGRDKWDFTEGEKSFYINENDYKKFKNDYEILSLDKNKLVIFAKRMGLYNNVVVYDYIKVTLKNVTSLK